MEFWSIIFKKLEDAKRQRVILQEAVHYFPPHASSNERLVVFSKDFFLRR